MTRLDLLKQKLDTAKINYKINQYKVEQNTVDEQVRAQKLKYKEGMSTLIFKSDGNFVVIFRRDDMNIDRKILKKLLHSKNLELCNENDLNKLGFEKGLVSPIFLDTSKVKIYIDEKVLEMDDVICGATEMTNSLRIKLKDLLKFIEKYEIINICFPNLKRQDDININSNSLILTGITPSGSGDLHIGNYIGCIKQMLDLQKVSNRIHFFIADLHALTTIQERSQLTHNIENMVLSYLSFGFNPSITTIYRQSDVMEHTELQSILNNVTPLGLIQRAHAYKDKLQKDTAVEDINMGLFNYPILMASDILLYDPKYIPVGEDQKQHVEITRDIASYFNNIYGKTFVLPEMYPLSKEVAKLIGTDGKRKMSKSLGNVISIFESEEIIRKQVFSCYTDPNRIHTSDAGETENNPIFTYHRLLNSNIDEVKDLENRYQKGKVSDTEVKEKLFKAILKTFEEPRIRYKELQNNPEKIRNILREGSLKAKDIAQKKMKDVKEKIGIINKYSL